MLRGCQRRVIVLRDTGNPRFEEAYVVLRDGDTTSVSPGAMVEEARKILRDGDCETRGGRHPMRRESLSFLAGMAFFALISLLAFLIFKP